MSTRNTKSNSIRSKRGCRGLADDRTDLRFDDQPTALRSVRVRTIKVLDDCAQEISLIPSDGAGHVLASALCILAGRIRAGKLMGLDAANADSTGRPDPEDGGVLDIALRIVTGSAAPNANPIRASVSQAAIDSVLEKLRQIRVELKPYRRADWTRAAGMIRTIEYTIRLGFLGGKGERVPGILGAVGLGKEGAP